MARFRGGWFKAWRDAWDKDLSQNIYLWAIWNALLHMATYKETQIIWGGEQRKLPPGSVVFGIKEIAERWDCSPRTISKWLHYLKKCDRIVLESCARGTIVTICNWAVYQVTEEQACAPTAHPLRTDCAPTAHQVALSEEGKKERKKKNTSGIRTEYPPEFLSLWDSYSKQSGNNAGVKSKAFKTYLKLKLTEADKDHLPIAMKNYFIRKPDWQTAQHFSTFLNTDWSQWLEPLPNGKHTLTEEELKERPGFTYDPNGHNKEIAQ